jgi:fumarate hydratase subunit alpha
MRVVKTYEITAAVKDLCIEAGYCLPDGVVERLKYFAEREESPVGKEILEKLIENGTRDRRYHRGPLLTSRDIRRRE